jgi:NAD(P)-dependent dehydrogenase (short-subunit alcohol dehydrogenase family)/rhamnose utilization protein RhaD (predicted bifunctional aldolase and dehydrogenase)
MDLTDLVEISRRYGTDEFALAGGGNTSCKDEETLAVKASGAALRTITEDGFVLLRRRDLAAMLGRTYSADPFQREAEVKRDLLAARVDPERGGRPSVEASLHELVRRRYVVHTHPYAVNALLCSRDCAAAARRLFSDEVLLVPASDPGYVLAKRVEEALAGWRKAHASDPPVILMQNHGMVVAGDSPAEVHVTTAEVMAKVVSALGTLPDTAPLPVPDAVVELLPAIRMLCSPRDGPIGIASIRTSALVQHFLEPGAGKRAALPFTPDHIVYCRTAPLEAAYDGDPARFIASFPRLLEEYAESHGGAPRVILVRGLGMIGVDASKRSVETCLDVFEERMKIGFLSGAFGGPAPLSAGAIRFIETWEVESYRRSVSTGGVEPRPRGGVEPLGAAASREAGRESARPRASAGRRVEGKVAVITGAAQGFGRGIAEGLFAEGANVVIADVNEAAGAGFAAELDARPGGNGAAFVRADVTDAASLARLAQETVRRFGGVDLLVSNAGVLRAGGLEEMSPESFDLVTRVNYTGYFLCVKTFAPVMRLQHQHRPGLAMDIVQVNSKSGLAGSNRNFAYAGGKFGGIGLTQSFALELVEDGIKVNAVCPGNFFEGPLWADPEKGLFVQYLRAGKVPGAKTIDDVRRFYESKVPMGRGCRPEDVVRAILYLVEQEYETGQALPVTGGQVMLA